MTNMEWALVGKAKQGDAHAFAKLYEKYYGDLYRFALAFMKGSSAAEDSVSSAVLKAYENLPKLRKDDSFKSWIFQITANECRHAMKQTSQYLADSTWEEPAATEEGFETPEIEELLYRLSEDERLVVTLSVFGGYNSREISTLVNKREGTIRSLKSRAFTKLRSYLNHKEDFA